MKGIDLFAGAGGNTIGALNAGMKMTYAANHWPLACSTHTKNHPQITTDCQDLQQADWSKVPQHDFGLASPCCQGHSNARGHDKPHHDIQRNTAWAVVGCAEYHQEDFWIVENVPEFERWLLYPSWLDAMKRLGYSMAPYLIDSADHGVPQNRLRLFMVFTRSKNPINLDLPKREHVGVNHIIEWDNYKWSRINKPGRSAATLERVRRGRKAYGNRFVAPYYGSGSGKTGRSIDRPLGTVTTLDRWAIIRGYKMRMFQPSELKRAMGFPQEYELPNTRRESIQMLGNAVCPPVVTDLLLSIKHHG